MNLEDYFARIHYHDEPAVDLQTLQALHRAHLLTIPYENLDIHLGRPLTMDLAHIYNKIVHQRRGGWCYEMNGLFAWVLREIGFDVEMLASRVGGPALGNEEDYDHLILKVQLDEPWLVDVGFGNGIIDPIPLKEGIVRQGFLDVRLERDGNGWLFHNHEFGASVFGFMMQPRKYTDFAARCRYLQTSPESGFVRSTVCHRYSVDGILSLRGAVLRSIVDGEIEEQVIEHQDEYVQVLHQLFDLDFDGIEALWPRVWQRHLEWVESEKAKK